MMAKKPMTEVKKIEVIESFLSEWKKKVFDFYTKLREKYQKEMKYENFLPDEIRENYLQAKKNNEYYLVNHEINNEACKKQYECKKEWAKNLNGTAFDLISKYGEGFEERLQKFLDKEVDNKRYNFVTRIEKKAGEIVDASHLRMGANGEINGIVTGTLESVKVETIYAGGHAVQCLHFRVLVKEIKQTAKKIKR